MQTDFVEIDRDEFPSVPVRQGSEGQAPLSAHPSGQARAQVAQANDINKASPQTDVDLRIGGVKKSPSVAAQAEHSDVPARERTATRMGGRKTDKSAEGNEPPSVAAPAEHSDVPARVRTATRMGGRKAKNPKSNIVVRLPVENDREAVRALARKLHNMTIFSDIEFSDTKFDKQFEKVMSQPRYIGGLVAELHGRIIGMAMVTAGEFFIGQDEILSTVQLIGVDEDLSGSLLSGKTFLRLIQAIKKWGELRGASRTLVHVTTGKNLAATDRLMRAFGAKCIGGGYVV